jgi:hypothetical protein
MRSLYTSVCTESNTVYVCMCGYIGVVSKYMVYNSVYYCDTTRSLYTSVCTESVCVCEVAVYVYVCVVVMYHTNRHYYTD